MAPCFDYYNLNCPICSLVTSARLATAHRQSHLGSSGSLFMGDQSRWLVNNNSAHRFAGEFWAAIVLQWTGMLSVAPVALDFEHCICRRRTSSAGLHRTGGTRAFPSEFPEQRVAGSQAILDSTSFAFSGPRGIRCVRFAMRWGVRSQYVQYISCSAP